MNDFDYMKLAYEEALDAMDGGNVPIGAVITIDDRLIGKKGNTSQGRDNYFSHAENMLIQDLASEIRRSHKAEKKITIYSTLEPCLQCFGAIVHNRIDRLVYACPDPTAGSTSINPPTDWYSKRWPVVERGAFGRDSLDLMIGFIEEHGWDSLPAYRDLKI